MGCSNGRGGGGVRYHAQSFTLGIGGSSHCFYGDIWCLGGSEMGCLVHVFRFSFCSCFVYLCL